MSLVLYRKYRPKTFSEVIGQENIKKILTSAVAMDRIAHAYLFTGPRGTGKTTIARILAKAINCSGRKGGEPCNKCQNCATINEGKTFDIVEIDAASNTGVDNIRELKTTIGFSPAHLKYKVFIIDEAHMLSKGAFNALLKTLEEPPAHAVFILATTEIHKIPATIISRSQRFDFRKLRLDEMAKRLKEELEKENIKVAKGVPELIALSSDGGMRDAESLLGQIISIETPGEEISMEEVKAILGLTDAESVLKCIEYLSENKTKDAILFLNEINFGGQDMEQFAASVINIFRKMLILKASPELRSHIAEESTKEQLEKISDLTKIFSEQELLWLVKKFINAKNEIKSAVMPQMPLELAAIEYDMLKNRAPASAEEKENQEARATQAKKNISAEPAPKPDYGGSYAKKEDAVKSKRTEERPAKKNSAEWPESKKKFSADLSLEEIKSAWSNILKTAKNYNHSISAFLKLSTPRELNGDLLVLATPYKFHAEKLSEASNRGIIEKVIAEVLKSASGIKVKIIQDENVKISRAAEPKEKSPEPKEKSDDPKLQSVIDIFGGEVE